MLNAFIADQEGSTAVEYALLAALVAMVIITGLTGLGSSLGSNLESTAETVNNS